MTGDPWASWVATAHPFGVDEAGRIAATTPLRHVREMIRLVLFTAPGERVNRPDFGCGLLNLVFEPNGSTLAMTTRFLVQAALQRWLGDVLTVHDVAAAAPRDDGRLEIEVVYSLKEDGVRRADRFAAPEAGS